MSDGQRRWWFTCDRGICLYSQDAVARLGDPARCIKHGALLISDAHYDGLSRREARKRMDCRQEATHGDG